MRPQRADARAEPLTNNHHLGASVRVGSELILLNPADGFILPELYGVERVIVLLSGADTSAGDSVLELREEIRAGDARRAFDVFMPLGPAAENAMAWPDVSPRNAAIGQITSAAHVDVCAFATSSGSSSRGYAVHAHHAPGPGANRPLLVYAGETRPCYSVLEASQMAHVLIHDASYGAGADRAAAVAGRSTSAQAAAVARAGGVRRLVLVSHRDLSPGEVAAIEEDAARFFRDVHLADGMLSYRITQDGVEQVSE